MNVGMQRQMQIYLGGLGGDRPEQSVALDQLREEAKERLDPPAFDYLDGGAGTEDTIRENRRAFERWRILPKMLRGVADRDMSVRLMGHHLPAPILLSPIGVLSILHPDGEMAAARAAASLQVPYVLSTVSSYSLEEVADAMGDGTRWFQLYWGKNPEFTVSLLERAELAGYSAIVVTLDTMILSWRERDIQHAYLPFLEGQGLANYFSDPAFRAALDEPPEENPSQAILYFAQIFSDASLTWDDVAFLKANTKLPVTYGYGLAVRGEDGVRDVVANLLADFDLTLGLAGCRSVPEIDRTLIRKVS